MIRDEEILRLAARARAAFKELGEALAAAAPDSEKEAIADRFNAITAEIAQLSGWEG
jgi:hypothetical protein